LITKCRFGYGHGLSVGSYTSGGLRHLNVNNCSFEGTTCGIRIKSSRGRGGLIEDLNYADITMNNVRAPFYISAYYPHEPSDPANDVPPTNSTNHLPIYRNMTFKNIKATAADEALKIWGLPESLIQNLQFENIIVNAKKGGIVSNVRDALFLHCSFVIFSGDSVKTFRSEVKGL